MSDYLKLAKEAKEHYDKAMAANTAVYVSYIPALASTIRELVEDNESLERQSMWLSERVASLKEEIARQQESLRRRYEQAHRDEKEVERLEEELEKILASESGAEESAAGTDMECTGCVEKKQIASAALSPTPEAREEGYGGGEETT